MDSPALIALVGLVFTVLVTLLGVAIHHGRTIGELRGLPDAITKLSEAMNRLAVSHEKIAAEHGVRLDGHDREIGEIRGRVTHLERAERVA